MFGALELRGAASQPHSLTACKAQAMHDTHDMA